MDDGFKLFRRRKDGKVIQKFDTSEISFIIKYTTDIENSNLGDVYNLRNVLAHEYDHYIMFALHLRYGDRVWHSQKQMILYLEKSAIQTQKASDTWLKTTSEHKKGVHWYWNHVHEKYGSN